MPLPDHEAHMTEVHAFAEQVRETAQTAAPTALGDAMAKAAGVVAPIYMGKAHEVIPDRYVIHFSITRCANCGTESRDNEFYALSYIRSRVNGTRVRHLVRCDRPEFNLPVDKIPTGIHRVPFCCECATIDLSHLPPPPRESELTTLPDPTRKGGFPTKPAAPAKKPTPPKAASLDDLI